jgi:3-isopropylmalate/(R)-2-methylmalate dehydratase large subunit
MSMTMAEKILATHAERAHVSPGEFVQARIDKAMVHEALGVPAGVADTFRRMGAGKVWDPDKVVAVLDHWVPAPTSQVADTHNQCREFVREYDIQNWYDMNGGISHQVLSEKGHVKPGDLIVGTDSHTTTYGAFGALGTGVGVTDMAIVFATGKLWFRVPETIKCVFEGRLQPYIMGKDLIHHMLSLLGQDDANYRSLEFHGSIIDQLSMDGRMTLSNMSIEAGAKDGLVPPDNKTLNYLRPRVPGHINSITSDRDAEFEKEIQTEVTSLDPQVAKPPSPANSVSVREVQGIEVDEAFVGTCTNGRLEDLEMTARILKSRKVSSRSRLVVIPASVEVYADALKSGLLTIIHDAGGIIEYPTCGPCIGGQLGVIGDGEVAIATMNRNFNGRMGSTKGMVYLASPATVAASAIEGRITDPREFLNS